MRLATLACCAALSCGPALAHHHGVERVRFQHYDVADGLSQLTVRAQAQDSAGFVWLGTQDGLNRFDGYAFRVYRHDSKQPASLGDNHVTALAAHPGGGVWVGLQAAGISRYVAGSDSFVHLRHDEVLRPHAGDDEGTRAGVANLCVAREHGCARRRGADPALHHFRGASRRGRNRS